MKYKYTAFQSNGKIIEGTVDASNESEVLLHLNRQGLKPISIRSMRGIENLGLKKLITKAINLEDKVFITKYMALMLRVGTDLFKAIDILISDFDKPGLKALLIEVKDSLSKGQPLYSTFAKYPRYFSPVFVNMIKAGEASGNLERVFEDLSVSLEKEESIRKKIRGALVYPSVLISLALLIMLLLVSFALPKIADVFTLTTVKPPLFSRVVFGVGLFFNHYIYIILPTLIGGGAGLLYFFRRTTVGQRYLERIANKTPVIKTVIFRIAIQRFASTWSSLLKAGMPIIESLEITADTVNLPELKAAIRRVAHEGIAGGLTVGEAFSREPIFPRVVVNLVSVSEKAGHIETILDTLANFYEAEIDNAIKTMLSLIEPVLLIMIGGMVAVIALSIIVPIYQLIGQI